MTQDCIYTVRVAETVLNIKNTQTSLAHFFPFNVFLLLVFEVKHFEGVRGKILVVSPCFSVTAKKRF
jgi:hypothetical protein